MEAYARLVAEYMRLLYQRGLVDNLGGNVSVRVAIGSYEVMLVTPAGRAKHAVTPDEIAIVAMDGTVLYGRPSSEVLMHLEIYRSIREARAVIHAHARALTMLARRVESLDRLLDDEHLALVKCVVVVPYRRPGSRELAEAVAKAMRESGCRVAILEKHGVVAYGVGGVELALAQALSAIEILESSLQQLAVLRR